MQKFWPIRRPQPLRWADSGDRTPSSGAWTVSSGPGSDIPAVRRKIQPIAVSEIMPRQSRSTTILTAFHTKICSWLSGKATTRLTGPGVDSTCRLYFIMTMSRKGWRSRPEHLKKISTTRKFTRKSCLLIASIWQKTTIRNMSCADTQV